MLKKMLIFVLVLLLGSYVHALDPISQDLVPDFQIAPFSQASILLNNGPDSPGVFKPRDSLNNVWIDDLADVVADQNYRTVVGFLYISNNNPAGFVINADGANNSESTYKLYHSTADNNGDHVMVYTLEGTDFGPEESLSGFGNAYETGNNTDVTDSSATLFSVASPTKATQDGLMVLTLVITGSEILDAFNTEAADESYTDTITLTLTET